jgi:hypothetical protein
MSIKKKCYFFDHAYIGLWECTKFNIPDHELKCEKCKHFIDVNEYKKLKGVKR